jgi:hypothetical protein
VVFTYPPINIDANNKVDILDRVIYTPPYTPTDGIEKIDSMNQLSDRFDFEEQVLQCWNIVDDLQIVFENVVETDMSRDDIANVLLGLKTLYQMKFQKTLDTFERLIFRGEIL